MLITEIALTRWSGNNKKYYEDKGYIYTKNGDEFEVEVGNLSSGSNALVEIRCDGCGNVLKRKWGDYKRRIKNGSNSYCVKCARSGFKKWTSFHDWCYLNLTKEEAAEILLRWDYDLNIDNLGNMITPNDISYGSYKEYWFKCSNHLSHTPEQKCVHDLTGNGQMGSVKCKQCNTISITNPSLVEFLVNKNDAYRISMGSHKLIPVKCPNCGYEKKMDMHTLSSKGFGCNKCSDGVSFPEKFISSMLTQVGVSFVTQLSKKSLQWCGKYKYDFYLPDFDCIIEAHGRQHYEEVTGSKWHSLEETQRNDKNKELLAIKNKVTNYVVLDCRNSEDEWIKNSVTKSILNRLLKIENGVNWVKCAEGMCSTLVKVASDMWRGGIRSTTEIYNKLGISEERARAYLKRGVMLGWCDYDPKEAMEKVYSLMRITTAVNRRMVSCLTTGEIFDSQKEAREKYGASDVSACCRGKRKHSGFHPVTGEKLAWEYYNVPDLLGTA